MRVGPLEHPTGRLPLFLYDIPRWPSVSLAECEHFLVKSDCYQGGAESFVIQELKNGSQELILTVTQFMLLVAFGV